MKFLQRVHAETVHQRRVRVLLSHLQPLLPSEGSVLDVGCGDGQLGAALAAANPHLQVAGIDVLVRPETKIVVTPFDGTTIPCADQSVDTVLLIDVLHHTEGPAVLLQEARRVARQSILIKDHTRDGLLANATLRFMDWVGNASYGVALPYHYLSYAEWRRLFDELDLQVTDWESTLRLYPRPADYLFGRGLHFIARISVSPEHAAE